MASSRQTFTHTSIPIHPSTLLKQTRSKTRNSPNMTPSLSCPLPAQCACGRRPGSLADAPQDSSTSEAFSPTTVPTENICRCVQHILQHFQTTMPFLTTSKIALSWLPSAVPQADSWWLGHVEPDDVVIADIAGQALDIFLHGPESAHKNGILKTFTHRSITMDASQKQTQRVKPSTHQTWCLRLVVLFLSNVVQRDGREARQILPWTAPRRRPSRLRQYWQKIFVDVFNKYTPTPTGNNTFSNHLRHNPFLPGFCSSPGWLLATRTRGAWWCRCRGHCGSGPRHLAPRSRVCAQEWHRQDKHSLTHPFPSTHPHS